MKENFCPLECVCEHHTAIYHSMPLVAQLHSHIVTFVEMRMIMNYGSPNTVGSTGLFVLPAVR